LNRQDAKDAKGRAKKNSHPLDVQTYLPTVQS
jgi:hypothetical protein